jgi:maleylacetoacetate isomerase
MKLYDYYRSTACYRVRITLNLKNIVYDTIDINLINKAGDHHTDEYHQVNPQELVPSLDIQGKILHQSLAIIEYLNELHPNPPLLPQNPLDKAKVRALALMVACDMHPLNNLRVLKRLESQFGATKDETMRWYHHWLKQGFDAIEEHLSQQPRNQSVCLGNHVSMADVCLIPQVYNAKRFNFDLTQYPLINQINEYCLQLEPFKGTAPTG